MKPEDKSPPVEGREEFVRENAVALVRERDEKIARQRRELARLNSAKRELRRALREARQGGTG